MVDIRLLALGKSQPEGVCFSLNYFLSFLYYCRPDTCNMSNTPVFDMETGRCLDPGENGTGLEGGGEAGPGPPERGKIGS